MNCRLVYVCASYILVCAFMIVFFSTRAQPRWVEQDAGGGIRFAQQVNWDEVKAKAREQNKFILVDCYATWCAPCKKMENEVFTDKAVGDFINEHFIAVRLQMDKTERDDAQIQQWYPQAAEFTASYAITAFPSFLFFSPEGKAVHKAIGFQSADAFIQEANNALDPQKQFYTIAEKDNISQMDKFALRSSALKYASTDIIKAERLILEYLSRLSPDELKRQDVLSVMMRFVLSAKVSKYAADYIAGLSIADYEDTFNQQFITIFSASPDIQQIVRNKLLSVNFKQMSGMTSLFETYKKDSVIRLKVIDYYKQLPQETLLERKNIMLFQAFSKSTQDPWFQLFYDKASLPKIDSSICSVSVLGMYYGRAKDFSNNQFTQEYLLPYMKKAADGEKVNWQQLSRSFKQKFRREFVEENVLQARVDVARVRKEKDEKYRQEYIRLKLQAGEKYGWDTTSGMNETFYVNNFAWDDIFMHSNNKAQLLQVAKWQSGLLGRYPGEVNFVDTYANLLYKAGKTKEAIQWETKALKMTEEITDQQDYRPAIQKNLEKMQRNEPTWQ